MPDSLIQPLFDGPLDIVGDVHGEIAALTSLMQYLGYDAQRATPKYIHKVASTRWFHERVFDFYLWNKGNN